MSKKADEERRKLFQENFYKFESRYTDGDFMIITYKFLDSAAWDALDGNAQKVYLKIRRKFNGHNQNDLSLTYKEGKKIVNHRQFIKAIDQLIKFGFVELLNQGWTTRKPNIYKLSNMWESFNGKNFGPGIEIKERKKRAVTDETIDKLKAAWVRRKAKNNPQKTSYG